MKLIILVILFGFESLYSLDRADEASAQEIVVVFECMRLKEFGVASPSDAECEVLGTISIPVRATDSYAQIINMVREKGCLREFKLFEAYHPDTIGHIVAIKEKQWPAFSCNMGDIADKAAFYNGDRIRRSHLEGKNMQLLFPRLFSQRDLK